MSYSHSPDQNVYQTVFDLTPVPMWIYDNETLRILKVNYEAIHFYGYSREEFLSLTISDLQSGIAVSTSDSTINSKMQEEWHHQNLFQHQKRDGSTVVVQIKSNPITYDQKKAKIVTAIDFTAHIHEQNKLKGLIENGKDIITIVDEHGVIIYVSPSSESAFGIPPIDLIGKNAFDLIHQDDILSVKTHLREVLDKKMVSTAPYRFLDAKGNWHWIQTKLSNHLNSPSINAIVANSIDVTKEVEKKKVDDLVTSITLAVSSPGLLSKCLQKGLNYLLQLDKICASEIWLVSSDENRINLVSTSQKESPHIYKNFSKIFSVDRGKGIAGTTWDEQHPLVFEDICNNEIFLRSSAAKSSNLRTAVSMPLLFNDEFLGCIVCFSQYDKEQLYDQTKFLFAVIGQLGAVIKHKITDTEYYNFFNISPNPHAIIGFDGLIKKCNRAFNKLLGHKENSILNQPISRFVHHEDQYASLESFKKAIGGKGRPKTIEARFLDSHGNLKTLIWSGISIPESKVFVVAAQDVTDQKNAEKDLKIAYERLRTANKMAKMGYWIKEYATDEIVWGEETYHIYECSPDNFTPTLESIEKAFHPEDRYLIKGNNHGRLEPGKVRTFENRIITRSGKMKWVRQEIRMLTNEQGEPYRIEGIIKDITERKKNEDQLSISNERFKVAMQASHEIIWEINHLTKEVVRGKSHNYLLTYPENDTFSEENLWLNSIHAEDRDIVWQSLNKTLKNKYKKSWKEEYRLVCSDGSIVYLIDRCYIIRDEAGNPVRTIGSIMDVTATRKQLEQIKTQNNNLREIAWLQSHVTRSPLSKIMGLTYLSKELDGGGKSKDEIMELITEAAYELDTVIRDITNKINLIRDEDSRNIDY